MAIKIENGVMPGDVPNQYRYDYWTAQGLDELDQTINRSVFHSIMFTAEPGEVPEIGDFIDNGKLVKRDGIQVTEGIMRWPSDTSISQNGWWMGDSLDTDWRK